MARHQARDRRLGKDAVPIAMPTARWSIRRPISRCSRPAGGQLLGARHYLSAAQCARPQSVRLLAGTMGADEANIALRRQLWQLDYYTEGSIPDAPIGVPTNWTPEQIKQFQDYWDTEFAAISPSAAAPSSCPAILRPRSSPREFLSCALALPRLSCQSAFLRRRCSKLARGPAGTKSNGQTARGL